MTLILQLCVCVEEILEETHRNVQRYYLLHSRAWAWAPPPCRFWPKRGLARLCLTHSLFTHVLEHLNFYVECQWFCASPEFTAPSAEGTPFPLRTAPPYTLEVAAPRIEGWA